MPPLVPEILAWLRFYTWLPIPRMEGEVEEVAPDPGRTGYAVPLAGALIGLGGGIVLIIAAALGLSAFVCAALAVIALMALTGGLSERAIAVSGERLGGAPAAGDAAQVGIERVSFGAISLAAAVILRVGAIAGLVALGSVKAALALVAAGALARAAAISSVLTHPGEKPEGETSAGGIALSLQWVALVALAVVAAVILPSYGVVPALAGIAAAVAATVVVTGFAARFAGANRRELSGVTEQAAEIAFLLALLGFASAF